MSSSTSSEVVVRTRHLGKAYQLYARRSDWLKQVVLGSWKTYYKPFWVLRDIDLEVYRGESIGILGRNGCGKSTLLQVICGMTLPVQRRAARHRPRRAGAGARRHLRSSSCRAART